ncbi:unnamed protein product [Cylindrotheca closterium]|uniref:DUF6816 domain-containing protein n=1 Tax=Cylindrotheca closterium TaxID=2856 RepID=A0AAD2FUP5_9STRA|nr:unnamed protein product [Cylindrotheca closterium]
MVKKQNICFILQLSSSDIVHIVMMKHTIFISALLLAGSTHTLTLNVNTQLERRKFIQTSTATTTIISALLGANHPANADPMNALIPVGSGALRQQPFVSQSEGWKEPVFTTKLGMTRIGSSSVSPIQQKPFSAQDVFYPSFLFGSWEVESTLVQKVFPFGPDFLPSKSLIEGSPRNRNEQLGSSTKYQAHYFSMTADGPKVDLSLGMDKNKIIADRRFNSISMSRAYQQLTPIEEVVWDYNADPTRLSLRFSAAPLADDMRPLGQRRGEVYLTARQTELAENGSFCAAERSRAVTVGPGTVTAIDQETITEFQPQSDGSVNAISRVAVYLTPNPNSREGVLWQQINGKAVAFFDYTWKMNPLLETSEVGGSKLSVVSPEGRVQYGL